MLRIITDFDGPIMDVSERYYRVYLFCLEEIRHPEQPINELSKEEFWQMKRSRVPEKEIALMSGLTSNQAQDFANLRRETVHTVPYLTYDRVNPDALKTLETIKKAGIDLVVMTMRRVVELDEPFQRYDLGRFFPPNRRYCLSHDYVKTRDIDDKPLLVKYGLADLPPVKETWMIGDTEADIVAAQNNHIKIIAVLSGIRDRHQLEPYKPDLIVNNLPEAVDFIFQHSFSPVR
jgi:phosphoglycolate phosphatase-like HAD superfamily hydrolase